jgi:uncharacterized protein YbjT (DUF2867 family)
MNRKLAVVVTGSAGKQGGAVVKALLARGHEVRAVTRLTDSARERELSKAGVVVFRAYVEDTASFSEALARATSFFAMTTPFEGGAQAEIRQSVSAADAAAKGRRRTSHLHVGREDHGTCPYPSYQ